MAGDWIKMRSNLATDPDVVDIAARVSLDEFSVVGRLHALWSWADQHSSDGVLPRATSAFVDRLTACPGFAEALRQVGWLDGRDSALRLPNWDRHNGNTAKTRSLEARKKQRQRDKCPDECPPLTGTRAGPEKRREEKSIPEDPPPRATAAPDSQSADHHAGWEPPLEMFVAECARYLVPAWYAEKKWEVHSAKDWRSGQTPVKWKKVVAWVKRDFINDGSPMTEQAAAPRNGHTVPVDMLAKGEDPAGWREWLKSQGKKYGEYQFAADFMKSDFFKDRKKNPNGDPRGT